MDGLAVIRQLAGYDDPQPSAPVAPGITDRVLRALANLPEAASRVSERFRGVDPQTGEADYWKRGGLAGLLGMPSWDEQSPTDIAMGFAGSTTPAVKGLAGALATPTKGIRAYHGSPHDFDRFDISKIGTGEGAQAYGHGLYFAENEGVARGYRDQLSPVLAAGKQLPEDLSIAIGSFGGDVSELLKFRRDQLDRWVNSGVPDTKGIIPSLKRDIRELERLEKKPIKSAGRMYEVQINADPERFLDWDKPLSGQHRSVANALKQYEGVVEPFKQADGVWQLGRHSVVYDTPRQKYVLTLGSQPIGRFGSLDEAVNAAGEGATGATAYQSLIKNVDAAPSRFGEAAYINSPSVIASKTMKEAGIPGIKYLDQGSRAAGEGSRNYVVFDDSIISILRKYGLLPAAGLGAATGIAEQ